MTYTGMVLHGVIPPLELCCRQTSQQLGCACTVEAELCMQHATCNMHHAAHNMQHVMLHPRPFRAEGGASRSKDS